MPFHKSICCRLPQWRANKASTKRYSYRFSGIDSGRKFKRGLLRGSRFGRSAKTVSNSSNQTNLKGVPWFVWNLKFEIQWVPLTISVSMAHNDCLRYSDFGYQRNGAEGRKVKCCISLIYSMRRKVWLMDETLALRVQCTPCLALEDRQVFDIDPLTAIRHCADASITPTVWKFDAKVEYALTCVCVFFCIYSAFGSLCAAIRCGTMIRVNNNRYFYHHEHVPRYAAVLVYSFRL